MLFDHSQLSCLLITSFNEGIVTDLLPLVWDYLDPVISHYEVDEYARSEIVFSRFDENAFYLHDRLYLMKEDDVYPVTSHSCAASLAELSNPQVAIVDRSSGNLYSFHMDEYELMRWEDEEWKFMYSVKEKIEIGDSNHSADVYDSALNLIGDSEDDEIIHYRFDEEGRKKTRKELDYPYPKNVTSYSICFSFNQHHRGAVFFSAEESEEEWVGNKKLLAGPNAVEKTSVDCVASVTFSGVPRFDLIFLPHPIDRKKVVSVLDTKTHTVYPVYGDCSLPAVMDEDFRIHTIRGKQKVLTPVYQHGCENRSYPFIV